MVFIEFERTENDGKDCTAVRVVEMEPGRARRVIASTVYLGQAPQLYMEQGCRVVILRLQPAVELDAAPEAKPE